jgi:hypothetical protein
MVEQVEESTAKLKVDSFRQIELAMQSEIHLPS